MKYVKDGKLKADYFSNSRPARKNPQALPKNSKNKYIGIAKQTLKNIIYFVFGILIFIYKLAIWAFKKVLAAGKTKKFWYWIIRLAALGFAVVAFAFIYYARELPDPNKLLARQIPQSTKIYSRDGILLYEIHGEYKRTLIDYSEMNENIRHATIAIEDKDFYNEGGINYKGIFRSIIVNIMRGSKSQGGSTITQQFVRSAMLSREKAFSRKIKEIILSIEINQRFSKDDVLKLYLNEISYGRNIYGIESAAQIYFNKHAKDLDLAESAYLAAIPQSPTYYNPTGPNRSALDKRKNLVLQAMLQQKYISEDDYNKAKDQAVTFQRAITSIKAPHFVFYVQDYLSQKYGDATLESGGLKVTTTLDSKLQEIAEKTVAEGAEKNSKKYNGNNAALVAIDPKTGQILAMVGSKDYFADPTPAGCKPGLNCNFEPNVNVAISERQPGSSAKPYVYVTAFKPEFGMAPASLRLDVVTNFGDFGGKAYIPRDYDGKERGPISIREALAQSLNIPAVKTLDLIGVDSAVQTMKDLGITSNLKNCQLSLVLGGCEVKLIDHVAAYSAFANMGTIHNQSAILSVEDSSGKKLEEFQDQSKDVLDPQSVYELVSIMTDNNARTPVFGSNSPLTLSDRPVAAKTGTTQNFHDGWTVGFTPSLAAGVWVGNNDGTLLKKGADAVVVAAPIWHNFMAEALKGTPIEAFPQPDGIQRIDVDALSGKLPGPYTQSTKNEVFASFSAPKEIDDLHVSTDVIDTTPGSTGTVKKTLTILRSEKPNDPNWELPVMNWAQANGYSYLQPGSTTPLPPPNAAPGSGQSSPPDGTGSTPIGDPPTINILSPQDNATIISLPINVQVSIVPDIGNSITRVDFLVDGVITQTLSAAPYTFTISAGISPGTHNIAVQAVDDKGNSADTNINIKIK